MKNNPGRVLLLGANFCGNVGDLYILNSLYEFLIDNGFGRIDICPYPKQNNRRIAQVNSNKPGVRLVEPSVALRSSVERIMRRNISVERFVSNNYFSTNSAFIKRFGEHFEINDYDRIFVLGGELDVPYSMLDTHSYLRNFNKNRVVYGPISIPFEKGKIDFLKKRFSEVAEVAVRDPATFEWLFSNGINNISLVPDTAFLSYKPKSCFSKNGSVGVCLHSRWGYDDSIDAVVGNIVSSVTGRGGSVVFFATNLHEDYKVIEKLKSIYSGNSDVAFVLPENVDELIRVVADRDVVISDRLHAIIVAMINGTAVLPIATRSKILGYCKYVGIDTPLVIGASMKEVSLAIDNSIEKIRIQNDFVEKAHETVKAYFVNKLEF